MKRFKLSKFSLTVSVLVASIAIVAGCNSSSGGSNKINAQAIDGYIVGGTVYCDNEENGGTSASGRLVCPKGTQLIRVKGGTDVGFNKNATSGEHAFIGELVAPGTLDFLTPLSTVAVVMSSIDDVFSPEVFGAKVDDLAIALGQSSLDLNADASSTLQIVKLNAQIHQIISGFVITTDDYAAVTKVFSALVQESVEAQTTVALTGSVVDTLMDLNARLAENNKRLVLDPADLQLLISDVTTANTNIESAVAIDQVTAAASGSRSKSVFTIDRNLMPVYFYHTGWDDFYAYSLKEYESDKLSRGYYNATIDTGYYTRVMFGSKAFTVNKSLTDVKISMGFEFESTTAGDPSKLSVTTTEVLLSAVAGHPESIEIMLPDNAKFRATSVDSQGTKSNIVFRVDENKLFSSRNGDIGINIKALGSELKKQGYSDITRRKGNYKATLVIGGVRVNMVDSGSKYQATTYTIDSGQEAVTGSGFQGYLSVVH